MLKISIFIITILLTSCLATPLDTNPFDGNFAAIDDSYTNSGHFGGGTHYFIIEEIDGIRESNAFNRAQSIPSNNYNQFGFSRNIEAKTLKLTLSAKILYRTAFNILASEEAYHGVSGEILFEPKVGKHYLVKGIIIQNYAAVWIEDDLGNLVSELVESRMLSNNEVSYNKKTLNIGNTEENASHARLFSNIMTGESSKLVRYKFGEPDEILHPAKNSTYIYYGLGKVRFTRHSKNESYVNLVLPYIGLNNLSKNSVESLIEPATGRTLRELAKEYYDLNIKNVEILDVFAEKIWKERNHKDRYMTDGVAWLCKIIGQSQNSRYKTLLETLLKSNTSNIKKSHIRNSLEALVDSNSPQFDFLN